MCILRRKTKSHKSIREQAGQESHGLHHCIKFNLPCSETVKFQTHATSVVVGSAFLVSGKITPKVILLVNSLKCWKCVGIHQKNGINI